MRERHTDGDAAQGRDGAGTDGNAAPAGTTTNEERVRWLLARFAAVLDDEPAGDVRLLAGRFGAALSADGEDHSPTGRG